MIPTQRRMTTARHAKGAATYELLNAAAFEHDGDNTERLNPALSSSTEYDGNVFDGKQRLIDDDYNSIDKDFGHPVSAAGGCGRGDVGDDDSRDNNSNNTSNTNNNHDNNNTDNDDGGPDNKSTISLEPEIRKAKAQPPMFSTHNVVALVLLCAQVSSHHLVTHYSRSVRQEKIPVSVTVLLMELFKMSMCVIAIGSSLPARSGFLLRTAWHMAIPAGIYFIQNLLTYVALQNLQAAMFSTVTQTKLLATALLSTFILDQHFSKRQWRALAVMTAGVVLVILDSYNSKETPTEGEENTLTGFVSALVSVVCSGLAGVAFQKIIKAPTSDIWERNLQLSVMSVVMGCINIMLFDLEAVTAVNPFADFSIYTFLSISIGGVGGILVAIVVKNTNAVVKGFATCCAIIVNSLLGAWMFGAPITPDFCAGFVMVAVSLFDYTDIDPAK
jgi:solute carrier family 35 (UDP-sugar transporter), member A1/2/3